MTQTQKTKPSSTIKTTMNCATPLWTWPIIRSEDVFITSQRLCRSVGHNLSISQHIVELTSSESWQPISPGRKKKSHTLLIICTIRVYINLCILKISKSLNIISGLAHSSHYKSYLDFPLSGHPSAWSPPPAAAVAASTAVFLSWFHQFFRNSGHLDTKLLRGKFSHTPAALHNSLSLTLYFVTGSPGRH